MSGGKGKAKTPKANNKQAMREGGLMTDEELQARIEKIKNRKERHERHLHEKEERKQNAAEGLRAAGEKRAAARPIGVNDTVRIKGLTSIGTVETTDNKQAVVIFGGMRTKMALSRLERVDENTMKESQKQFAAYSYSRQTRETIDEHRNQFKQEIDVRGMRTDEALNQVQHFIDDAILVGVSQVRILHGKGNGILRTMIRQYLNAIPNVRNTRDEHVQFGGAGITVVEL